MGNSLWYFTKKGHIVKYQKYGASVDKNTFFRNGVEAITSSLIIEDALTKCLRFMQTLMPMDIMSIHLWEGSLNSLRIAATTNGKIKMASSILIPIPKRYRGIPEWLQNENLKIYNNFREDPISVLVQEALVPIFGPHEYSHMIMRVKIEEERICDVVALAKGPDRYTWEHAELFEMLHSTFGIAVSNALHHREIMQMKDRLMEDNRILKERLSNWSTTNIVGAHAGMQHVVRRIKQVGNTNAPVLILGETGTGKDVVASALQEQSSRRDRAFVRLNCGAIPESLLDTELFGHEKGAFTGAHITHIGRIERADGGTLFLDEVGELSQSAQAKLLRVLQNGEIERIGGSSTRHVDVRVIAATHCDLEAMVADGRFRADLYYRLSVFPIIIPPLRERLSDIQLLTDSLIKKCSTNMNIAPPTLAPGAINVLLGYNWPGNVRELANVIERAMINNPEGPLTFPELNFGVQTNSDRTAPLPILDELVPLDEINRKYINYVLENVDGKIHGPGGAAEILEINPHTLRSRMDKLGISYRKQANSKSGTR